MNSNLDKIAQDLYGKIQTRFNDIKIGDENATVLSKKEDIPNARFFEFEYEEDGVPMGTIAITLDAQDGVVVQVSGDLTDDSNKTTSHNAYKFLRGFRQFAKDRLLNFDIQNIGKSNLDKRDYEFQAKRKEEPVMAQQPVMENKMYGNNRMSYQDLGEARLVVKHSQPINLDLAAGRTMHIESIYIENSQGERFKYPFKHLNGARALAEHIKHGGTPYDAIGKHISGLSEELASLRKFKGFVSRQEQVSEAMGNVTGRVIDRIEEIKETIQKLQRTAYYETFVESFEEQEEQMIPEELQNDLIDRLTVRTFNEELKSVFPYIARFVKESELPVLEITAEDLLAEGTPGMGPFADVNAVYQAALASFGQPGGTGAQGFIQKNQITDPAAIKAVTKAGHDWLAKNGTAPNPMRSPEEQFESFMDDIIREDKDEIFSPLEGARNAAIDKLNDVIAQDIMVGSNGNNAVMSIKGLIDDQEFIELLRDAPAETKFNDLLKGWINTEHEDLLGKLRFPDEEASTAPAEVPAMPAEVPAEPQAAAPAEVPAEPQAAAPEAPVAQPVPTAEPVAESEEDKKGSWRSETPWKKTDPKKNPEGKVHNLAGQALKKTIEKAKKAGATLETQLDFGHGVKTLAEIIAECGMEPAEFGFEEPREEGLPAMLKYISGFYNKDEGNFPLGGQRVKIKVKKAFEDGEFGNASEDDVIKVLKFIDAKDPSGNEHNQIMRLAGVRPDVEEDQLTQPDISGLENLLKGVKVNVGGDNFDFNDPNVGDKIGQAMQKHIGGALQGVANQAPNQNVEIPGGQINPQSFMRALLDKMNQGRPQ